MSEDIKTILMVSAIVIVVMATLFVVREIEIEKVAQKEAIYDTVCIDGFLYNQVNSYVYLPKKDFVTEKHLRCSEAGI